VKSENTLVLFCNSCGSQNKEEARFCSYCGNKLVIITEGGTLAFHTLLDRRYKIIRLIKSGGMGAVYEAIDERFGDRCAVKEMCLQYFLPEERKYLTDKFRQEARILRTLHHRSLPRVIDYFTEHGRYYLVMDFVDGEDLETVLEKTGGKGLDEKKVIKYSIEVLDVLSYLHNYTPPILYRDLKPSNIMVRKTDGKVMLVDFGIARAISQETPTPQTRVGTPNYAAPEQFKGQNEQRSDLYSLAATMHHLITGQIPVPCALPPIRNIKNNVSEKLERILLKALSIEPNNRYASAEKMKEALRGLFSEETVAGVNRDRVCLAPEREVNGMIFIPAGECILGSNEENKMEYPEHRVYLDAYYIDKYPVTNREYSEFTKATGYRSKGNWRTYFTENAMEHPVTGITWFDAKIYAEWKGKLLPTEAEWEKAARGSEGHIYPWGKEDEKNKCNNQQMDSLDAVASMINMSDGRGTTPVDTFLDGSSIYGVMDMAGNVKEFCSDWYSPYYYTSPNIIRKNPSGPEEGEYKVIKGGSWKCDVTVCKGSSRDKYNPYNGATDIGFRCVLHIKKGALMNDYRKR